MLRFIVDWSLFSSFFVLVPYQTFNLGVIMKWKRLFWKWVHLEMFFVGRINSCILNNNTFSCRYNKISDRHYFGTSQSYVYQWPERTVCVGEGFTRFPFAINEREMHRSRRTMHMLPFQRRKILLPCYAICQQFIKLRLNC